VIQTRDLNVRWRRRYYYYYHASDHYSSFTASATGTASGSVPVALAVPLAWVRVRLDRRSRVTGAREQGLPCTSRRHCQCSGTVAVTQAASATQAGSATGTATGSGAPPPRCRTGVTRATLFKFGSTLLLVPA
jgi:hypothetical protein